MTNESGNPRTRLDTWGEIARYLGVETRTAQRWQKHLGLPVHKGAGGQRTHAYTDEVDAWQQSREHKLPTDDGDASGEPETVVAPTPSRRTFPLWSSVLVATVALTAVAVTLFVQRRQVGASEPVTKVILVDGHVAGINASGHEIWRYVPDRPLAAINTTGRPDVQQDFEPFDLDGDGRDEWLGLVVSGAGTDAVETLICLSPEGKFRWQFGSDMSLEFRAGMYKAPWRIFDIEPVIDGADRSVWLAVNHSVWWPGAVLKLSPNGVSELRYVQPGSVRMVKSLVRNGRHVVLAGGVINGSGSASIAVLDTKGPPAAAPPIGPDSFDCLNCPTAMPLALILLPRTPVNKAAGLGYNQVEALTTMGTLRATTFEAQAFEGASVLFELDDQWNVTLATPTDGYWAWVAQRGHGLSARDRAFPDAVVRQWDQGAWRSYSVRVAPPAAIR